METEFSVPATVNRTTSSHVFQLGLGLLLGWTGGDSWGLGVWRAFRAESGVLGVGGAGVCPALACRRHKLGRELAVPRPSKGCFPQRTGVVPGRVLPAVAPVWPESHLSSGAFPAGGCCRAAGGVPGDAFEILVVSVPGWVRLRPTPEGPRTAAASESWAVGLGASGPVPMFDQDDESPRGPPVVWSVPRRRLVCCLV